MTRTSSGPAWAAPKTAGMAGTECARKPCFAQHADLGKLQRTSACLQAYRPQRQDLDAGRFERQGEVSQFLGHLVRVLPRGVASLAESDRPVQESSRRSIPDAQY